MLKEWFENKKIELIKIYTGSVHQFTRKSFDDNCLNKGPTLTVVESENGRRFGGFTSQNWTRKDGSFDFYTEDAQAWIFSLDCAKQFRIKPD